VVVNDLGGTARGTGSDQAPAQRVVDEIKASGGRAIASQDSVSTPEGGEAIVQAALESFGRVDIVINNAGFLRDKSFAKLDSADLDAIIDVHLKAGFYVSQPAFRIMKENGYGRFVFTSSNAGVFGNFGQSAYGAAKTGVIGLSNVLAIEGASANIKSNVICPIASTRMTSDLLGSLSSSLSPELVAPMVIYLASDDCQVSQEVFSAGGGRYARVFLGLTPGWYGGTGKTVHVEDIQQHLDEIRAEAQYTVVHSVQEEIKGLLPLLKRP
jgi:NAD(P)-dependent dehydrogenase (short-subunit alcohol dehydrogenase family)